MLDKYVSIYLLAHYLHRVQKYVDFFIFSFNFFSINISYLAS